MSAQVCPVVGTTNSVLPPNHPKFDLNKPGQECPVTKATTDHHGDTLEQHPSVPIPAGVSPTDAAKCPALKKEVGEEQAKKLDDEICPVVGTATTVLPPDHPDMKDAEDDAVCPKTNAKVGHHKKKVVAHPAVPASGGVCPVVGAQA